MVTAKDVQALRKRTGVGMMACKKALTEANGDMDLAIELLRKRGEAKAGSKAERETNEGGVAISGRAIIAVHCETDFVARNENFVAMIQAIADKANEGGAAAAKEYFESVKTDKMQEMGENLKLATVEVLSEGDAVAGYVHNNKKIGVLVALNGGTEEHARDVAMHAAAMDPLVANPEDVPADAIEAEVAIYKEQLTAEGKPEAILDKIIKGKVQKFCADRALTSQTFVKDPSKTVQEFLGDARVARFVRFSV